MNMQADKAETFGCNDYQNTQVFIQSSLKTGTQLSHSPACSNSGGTLRETHQTCEVSSAHRFDGISAMERLQGHSQGQDGTSWKI